MIISIMGKQAFRDPSMIDQNVMPAMLASAYFSGTMPNAGAAKSASRMVTVRVMRALFQPDILRPIISINSSTMGIAETSAAMVLMHIIKLITAANV